jgi:hypothetical protein
MIVQNVLLRSMIVQSARHVVIVMQLLQLLADLKRGFHLNGLSVGMSALPEAISHSASLESVRHPRVRMPGSTRGKRAKAKHRLM